MNVLYSLEAHWNRNQQFDAITWLTLLLMVPSTTPFIDPRPDAPWTTWRGNKLQTPYRWLRACRLKRDSRAATLPCIRLTFLKLTQNFEYSDRILLLIHGRYLSLANTLAMDQKTSPGSCPRSPEQEINYQPPDSFSAGKGWSLRQKVCLSANPRYHQILRLGGLPYDSKVSPASLT